MIDNLSINTINTYNISPFPQEIVRITAPNNIASWEIIGDDSENFKINEGILSFLNLVHLDKEKYTFNVKATSDNNDISIVTIEVNILSVEQITSNISLLGNNLIFFNYSMIKNITKIISAYPDLNYNILGPDKDLFKIEDNIIKFILTPTKNELILNPNFNIILEAIGSNYKLDLSLNLNFIDIINVDLTPVEIPKNLSTIMENQYEVIKLNSTSIISLSGNDHNNFEINNNIIKFKVLPDYESPLDEGTNNSYHFTITAQDNEFKSSLDVIVFVSNIINETESLIIPNYNFGVYETETDVIKVLPDNISTISITGEDNGLFRITSENILKLIRPSDFESDKHNDHIVKKINLEINDTKNNFTKLNLFIEILDVNEDLPYIINLDKDVINTPENEKVILNLLTNKQVLWILDGIDRDYFSLFDGRLEFRDVPDYETIVKKTFQITVKILDLVNQERSYPLIINLIDINEEPPSIIMEKEHYKIYEDETHITKLKSDQAVTWDIVSDKKILFYYGVLSLKTAIPFNKLNQEENKFVIIITVVNKKQISTTKAITVEILPVKSMITFGDPHIISLDNSLYELPKKIACYRLLQGKRLFINVKTRKLFPNEKLKIRKINKHLVNDGVFYHKIFICSENYQFMYDFDTTVFNTNNSNYFKFINRKIKFTNKFVGTIIIEIVKSKNVQNKHNFKLNLKGTSKNLTGLLISEYYVPSMEILDLKDTTKKKGTHSYNRIYSKLFS